VYNFSYFSKFSKLVSIADPLGSETCQCQGASAMASSCSILLWPLERLQSPSGSFNVQKRVQTKSKGMSQRPRIVCHSRGKGGAEHERAKLTSVSRHMRLLLESDGLLATEAAYSLVNSMNAEGRTALISALFPGKQTGARLNFIRLF